MLEAKLDELVGDELIKAFRQMFLADAEHAKQEMLEILDMFSEPQDRTEVDRFVVRLAMALVSEDPDPSSWFEMIAAGSVDLSSEQDYASSKELRSRARYLARRKNLYLGDIEQHRRAWAAQVADAQEGVRLILFSIIVKELRKNVAAKAALGPAWPLMVSVNDHLSADYKRQLHWFGADSRLHVMLAEAVRGCLDDFVETNELSLHDIAKTGDWRRTLPPRVDAKAYFARSTPNVAPREPNSFIAEVLAGPRPSFLTEEMVRTLKDEQENQGSSTDEDELWGSAKTDWQGQLPWLMKCLLPGRITPADHSQFESFSAAVCALARSRERNRLIEMNCPSIHSDDFKSQIWLKHWIEIGGGMPPQLPLRFLGYIEEEAHLAHESHGEAWPGYNKWKSYGILGKRSKLQPATLEILDFDDHDISWSS